MWSSSTGERAGVLGTPPAGTEPAGAVAWVRLKLGMEPDAEQARVLEPGTRRGLLNCTRQWGKSTIAAAKAVYEAQHHPGSLTLVVGPSLRQSGELVRKAKGFVERAGIRVKGDGNNEISLTFRNGSRIVGLPANAAALRGFSAVSLLLVDEASRVSDELYLAMRPMLAVSGGALWLMSTPFGKRGFFYDLWTTGGPDWLRVCVPATECPRIPAEFLAEERREMPERWFRQEYLCEFAEVEERIFDPDLILQAFSEDVEPLVLT